MKFEVCMEQPGDKENKGWHLVQVEGDGWEILQGTGGGMLAINNTDANGDKATAFLAPPGKWVYARILTYDVKLKPREKVVIA